MTGSVTPRLLIVLLSIKTKIYVMYKDLSRGSLTITDKLLGVASQFSSAAYAWARSVGTGGLPSPAVNSFCCRCSGKLLLQLSQYQSFVIVSEALGIPGSSFCLYK